MQSENGGNAVLIPYSEFDSLMETIHLLSTPANARHLANSIAQLRANQIKPPMGDLTSEDASEGEAKD
ncbi:type II toxin-antitoxin system Phd/YefM family antitoxin [uncultured Herbaspirillum sp.]|uniref:type II toxin-antitoxin system Phd/YefM family antitoxin n=1 Tax=uncultured Herbaspirillum sp. TaxID=160236 RepID=UPI0025882835|nr:type II toxin-antitoxin system Phd/YefM family antitoxin [uncultured Herbaspirillum sp.]